MDGTVAAASGVQAVDHGGRIRTTVQWGQGIHIRPAGTIQRVLPRRADAAVQTTAVQAPHVQTSIPSDILPGHASVTDAITRLQRERDLALRRNDELHKHYKKEIKQRDDADRQSTLIGMEQWTKQVRDAQQETIRRCNVVGRDP